MSYDNSFYLGLRNDLNKLGYQRIVKQAFPPALPVHSREAIFSHHNNYGSTGCLALYQKIPIIIHNSHTEETLENLINKKIFAYAYNWITKKIVIKPAFVFPSGKKLLYRITLESGKVVDASIDHTFFVSEESKVIEKTLNQLKIGDKLAVKI